MERLPRGRLTAFGAIVIGTLAVAVVAVFVGSRTVSMVGFAVAVLMVLLLIADRIPAWLKVAPVRADVRKAARSGEQAQPDYLEREWEARERERVQREELDRPSHGSTTLPD